MPFLILHSCSLQWLHACIINNIIILDPCTNLLGICHGKDRLAFSDLQPRYGRLEDRVGLDRVWKEWLHRNCWIRNSGAGHGDVTTDRLLLRGHVPTNDITVS